MDLPAGYRLTIERKPSDEDRRALSDALGTYNEPFLPNADPHGLAVLVRGPGGELRRARRVHLCRLAVYPLSLGACRVAARRRRSATDGRGRAPCPGVWLHSAWVDTFSFQAPGFYAKLGYREFGRLDYPPDHQRIFLQKQLVAE